MIDRDVFDLAVHAFDRLRMGGPSMEGRSHFHGSLSSDEFAAFQTLFTLVADPDTLVISKVDAEHWHRSAVAILEPFMRDEHLADRLVRASYALDALLEGQPK